MDIFNQLLMNDNRELNLETKRKRIDESVFVSKILGVVEVNSSLHLAIEDEVQFELFAYILENAQFLLKLGCFSIKSRKNAAQWANCIRIAHNP